MQSASPCAVEIERVHGVWDSQGFLPFYNDVELTAYLTTVGRRAAVHRRGAGPVVVLPVYTQERLCFVRDGRILISTGLLLDLESEEPLAQVLANQRARLENSHHSRRASSFSPCALLWPSNKQFEQIQSTLARQVAQYQQWTRPRLKIRFPRPTETLALN